MDDGTTVGTILLVDDEPDILDAVESTLESYLPGCTILKAASGPEALDILRQQKVHVILSDYRMPAMDGLQFLEEARSISPHAVRIMITAYPDLDLALRALNEEHVMNFITKPVAADRLVAVVREALAVRKDAAAQARAVAVAIAEARKAQAEGLA